MILWTTYLLEDPHFSTCKGLQSSPQFLVFDACGILNILKAKLLSIIEQHQNYSLQHNG